MANCSGLIHSVASRGNGDQGGHSDPDHMACMWQGPWAGLDGQGG